MRPLRAGEGRREVPQLGLRVGGDGVLRSLRAPRGDGRQRVEAECRRIEGASGVKDGRALQGVSQLTQVPRTCLGAEGDSGAPCEGPAPTARVGGELGEHHLRDGGDILSAVAERWPLERKYRQPVIQVPAEASISDGPHEVHTLQPAEASAGALRSSGSETPDGRWGAPARRSVVWRGVPAGAHGEVGVACFRWTAPELGRIVTLRSGPPLTPEARLGLPREGGM